MATVDLNRIVDVIDAFVQRTRGTLPNSVTPDTPLLAEGWVDSFALIELIGQLREHLLPGLSDSDLIPEDFESPRTLFARLLSL